MLTAAIDGLTMFVGTWTLPVLAALFGGVAIWLKVTENPPSTAPEDGE